VLSFFMLVPAVLIGARVGPSEAGLLCLLVSVPALTGTLLAWTALRRLRSVALRGSSLALLAAVAWPLMLVTFVVILTLVLCTVSLQRRMFHGSSERLALLTVVAGVLGSVAINIFLLRRWLRLWKTTRPLPQQDISATFRRVPPLVFWPALSGFVLLALLVVFGPRHTEPGQTRVAQMPTVPSVYEVGFGDFPSEEGRVFRSNMTVPPGYTLTLRPVLLSNQVPVKPLGPDSAVILVASGGQPVQAQLSWRLLGGTTLADGAPLQFTVTFVAEQDDNKSFHLVTPEPVAIDWVCEHTQLWPPPNGHTRFVLMKGSSDASSAQASFATEWAVTIEERLDPIPEHVADKTSRPQIILGTNWAFGAEAPSSGGITPSSTQGEALSEPAIREAQIGRYMQACSAIKQLEAREKELLIQFTPDNTWVKTVREEITAQQELKRQLEAELARTEASQVARDVPADRP
jgi:hypothetical protein